MMAWHFLEAIVEFLLKEDLIDIGPGYICANTDEGQLSVTADQHESIITLTHGVRSCHSWSYRAFL